MLIGLTLFCAGFLGGCHAEPSADDSAAGRLVTGKRISEPEERQSVGSWPMNMVATPDGRFVITSDMGWRESLWAIRMEDGRGVSEAAFSNKTRNGKNAPGGEAPKDPAASAGPKTNGLYYGLAASADGTVYAAQGGHDSIAVLRMDAQGNLTKQREIRTRKLDFPAGLALDGRGLLLVANNTSGESNQRDRRGAWRFMIRRRRGT